MVALGHLEDVDKEQESFVVKDIKKKKLEGKLQKAYAPLKKEKKVNNDPPPPPLRPKSPLTLRSTLFTHKQCSTLGSWRFEENPFSLMGEFEYAFS